MITNIIELFDESVSVGTITACHPPANDNKLIEFKAMLVVLRDMQLGDDFNAHVLSILAKCDGTGQPPDFIEGVGVESVHAKLHELTEDDIHPALERTKQC